MAKVSSVRIELNYEGLGELLNSAPVAEELDRRAQNVAKAARGRGITVENDEPIPVTVETGKARSRVRSRVILDHPAGLAVEAKHRLLGGSLDAARD